MAEDDTLIFKAELLSVMIKMSGWYNIFFCVQDIPCLLYTSQSHAESALAGAGLKYTYADSQYSDTVPAGNVISQTKSGETVAAGTTITLTLSKGKQEICLLYTSYLINLKNL